MKKAIILGSPGSGKSYFARQLKELTGLPLIHLDNIWWKPDRTHISREEFDTALSTILSKDEWILDGDYSRTYEVRMRACDTVFFLDYSMEECMSGIVHRVGQERPDIPWTENTIDPELVKMVCRYKEENRPVIMELLSKSPEKEVHIFSNREETETWLRNAVSGYHQMAGGTSGMLSIDELLQTPYWIIDILPEQVQTDSPGNYFAVEKYFLGKHRMTEIKQKHINVILKLNCYKDISLDDVTEVNPVPEHIAEEMLKRYVNIRVDDSLIISEADYTHMTLFNADEALLGLIRQLAASEGMFVWKPQK